MNSWILEFPENERVELVSRMKTGTNVQYEQALAEIIIYIALNRLGYKDPTRRPDFLARNQAGATVAYVEVTSFIQEFVSQPPIKAFDDGILDRLTRCDVVPFHLGPIRPLQDRVTGELAAIVADNHLRLASSLDDPVQLTGKPQAGKGRIGDAAQAFPGAIVDDHRHPEPAIIGELIRHEVQ